MEDATATAPAAEAEAEEATTEEEEEQGYERGETAEEQPQDEEAAAAAAAAEAEAAEAAALAAEEKRPLTAEMVAEGLSGLAKTGDGSGYALVRLELRERDVNDVEEAGQRLEHVRFADLSHNRISDPSPLTTRLRHLLSLDLGWNVLSGDLDRALPRQLPYLQWASFEHNRLTGIGNLDVPLLSTLVLSFNRIATVLFTGAPALEVLEMRGNMLTSTEGFGASIRRLDLSENKVERIVLTGMHALESLDLHGNKLRTLEIEGAADAKKLATLNLRDNKVEDFAQVAKLAELPALRNLTLSGNPCDQHDDYRMEALVAVRQLTALDDEAFSEDDIAEAGEIATERKAEADAKAAAEREAELERQRVLEEERARQLQQEEEEARQRKEAEEREKAAEAAAATAAAEAEAEATPQPTEATDADATAPPMATEGEEEGEDEEEAATETEGTSQA